MGARPGLSQDERPFLCFLSPADTRLFIYKSTPPGDTQPFFHVLPLREYLRHRPVFLADPTAEAFLGGSHHPAEFLPSQTVQIHPAVSRGMEIKDKQIVSSGVSQCLVIIMQIQELAPFFIHYLALFVEGDHRVIKGFQLMIFEIWIVRQTPLSAAVVKTVSIPFSGEIDPFWMTKFVAHEIQISVPT